MLPIGSALGFSDDDVDYFNMPMEELANQKISVASKQGESIVDAPSMVTLFTREEI